jgi:ubiquitin C-terminal hydrolase
VILNNDHSNIQPSLIRDIFGGVLRNEFHIERSNKTSVTFEPFFILNLEISRCEDLESCLQSFFNEKRINDYKVDGVEVRAVHQTQFEKLPTNLIL